MRSCCKQVKEFVSFGKNLHAEVHKLYEKLNEREPRERVRMLLDFLSRHEQHMQEALARFEKSSRSGILEAWLEYSPGLDVDEAMRKCAMPDHPGTDDLVKIALEFDDTLVRLYREVAEKVHDQKTKELFVNLLHLEEQEKIQITRAAMSLWDM